MDDYAHVNTDNDVAGYRLYTYTRQTGQDPITAVELAGVLVQDIQAVTMVNIALGKDQTQTRQ